MVQYHGMKMSMLLLLTSGNWPEALEGSTSLEISLKLKSRRHLYRVSALREERQWQYIVASYCHRVRALARKCIDLGIVNQEANIDDKWRHACNKNNVSNIFGSYFEICFIFTACVLRA